MQACIVRKWKAIATASTLVLLQGCANLESVREFGKTAAELSSFPDAGKAYQESARVIKPYLAVEPVLANRAEVREEQVKDARAVQATLAAYFATLAKLAGEDMFSLDKELDGISKGLQALPSGLIDAETANAAVTLAKTLQKYVLARAQAKAVRELVQEGGPPAMRILDRLQTVATSWHGSLANDQKTIGNTLAVLGMARDTPPLLGILAKTRQMEVDETYRASLKRIDTAKAALGKIKEAHTVMETNLDRLDSQQVQVLLKQAVADMKSIKKQFDVLN